MLAFLDLDLARAAAYLRRSLQMAHALDGTLEMAVAIAALALVAWANHEEPRGWQA